jgi:hypothetical protein
MNNQPRRSERVRGLLPFQQLPNADFHEQMTTNSNVVVANTIPNITPRTGSRRRGANVVRATNWTATPTPYVEDGVYHFRYECLYNGSRFRLPNASTAPAWDNFNNIFRNFAQLVREMVYRQGGPTVVDFIRIYVVGANESLELASIQRRQARSTYFRPADASFMNDIVTAVRKTIMNFIEYYDDVDERDNLKQLRLFVDMRYIGGAGRNTDCAATLRHIPVRTLFNPSPGRCLPKCFRVFINQLKADLVGPEDNIPPMEALQWYQQHYPQYSYRLLDPFAYEQLRLDGSQWNQSADMCMFLILEDGHYYLIRDVVKFVKKVCNMEKYCVLCAQPYMVEHSCGVGVHCDKCGIQAHTQEELLQHQTPLISHEDVGCEFCNLKFYSQACVANHYLTCTKMSTYLNKLDYDRANSAARELTRVPRPDRRQCFNCRKRFETKTLFTNHQCYIPEVGLRKAWQKDDDEEKEPPLVQYYAFDFETLNYESPTNPLRRNLEVNCVCVQRLYDISEQTWVFKNMEEFLSWLSTHIAPLTEGDQPTKVIFFAHNLSKFDGRIFMSDIFQRQHDGTTPTVNDQVMNGMKLHSYTWNGIIFKDSLLHLPFSVAKMPGVFEFDAAKGWFPHHLNIPENQGKSFYGMPALSWWKLEFFKRKDAEAVRKWWTRENERLIAEKRLWRFDHELVQYCINDVVILRQALEKYNDAGVDKFGSECEPLSKLTISSYTKHIYDTSFRPPKTIGYHTMNMNKFAREALRGGKTDVRQFYVGITKEQFLSGKRMIYVDVCSMYPYVMVAKEYPKGKPRYVDPIDSLTLNENILLHSWGFAKVAIDPPLTYDHHPPITCRDEAGKLTATLTKKYSVTLTFQELHDAIKKGWTVTTIHRMIVYPSSTKEMYKEFMILLIAEKIHSSYDYISDEWFNDLQEKWFNAFGVKLEKDKVGKNPGKRALFKLMLNCLWGKQCENQHDSFSVNITNEQFRNLTICEAYGYLCFKKVVNLGPNRWYVTGVYTQYDDNANTQLNIARVLASDKYPKQRLDIQRPDFTSVLTKPQGWHTTEKEYLETNCVQYGAYVTMWGRSVLQEQLDLLAHQVVYHDTDSVIYIHTPTGYDVPQGGLLGEWEVEQDNIIEFCALAPKTYAYRYLDKPVDIPENPPDDFFNKYQPYWIIDGKIRQIKEECKAKGLTLHDSAASKVNFQGLKDLYFNIKQSIIVDQETIHFNVRENVMQTYTMKKATSFMYTKGLLGKDNTSYPFGSELYWDAQKYADSNSLRRSQ